VFDTPTSVAHQSPPRARSRADGAPKRSRKRTLTAIDKRTVLGKRLIELRELFTAVLTATGVELSPMRRLQIDQASQALATAEHARGLYMREGHGDLADLITAERRADSAIKAIGLPPERPTRPADAQSDLAAYIAPIVRPSPLLSLLKPLAMMAPAQFVPTSGQINLRLTLRPPRATATHEAPPRPRGNDAPGLGR
jgi:hypothetical protein